MRHPIGTRGSALNCAVVFGVEAERQSQGEGSAQSDRTLSFQNPRHIMPRKDILPLAQVHPKNTGLIQHSTNRRDCGLGGREIQAVVVGTTIKLPRDGRFKF